MDIGFLLPTTIETGDVASIARRLESTGFGAIWIPEHPAIPAGFTTPYLVGGQMPEHYKRWLDPFVALTIAATATSKIKLGTGICLLPERETIVTAKAVASFDVVSGGRFLFGVGGGWLKEETEVFGVKFGARWKLMREMVEAMRLLWTQEQPSYAGEMVHFPPVWFAPKPVQKPHPPIILGAHGQKALERVARLYDGWMPLIKASEHQKFAQEVAELKKLTREHGRDPQKLVIAPLVMADQGSKSFSEDNLKRLHEAGANQILPMTRSANDIADGAALKVIDELLPVVEHAAQI